MKFNDKKYRIKYPEVTTRLKQTIDESGMTLAEIADILEVSEAQMKQLATGRNIPSLHVIRLWAKHFKKSYRWIIDGD